MNGSGNSLSVLITNAFMQNWTGSELYLRDLGMELIKRGHKPVIYSPRTGKLAELLRSKSIPVVADLNLVGHKPNLIHGQHHLETMTALAHYPGTPAVYFCHGWLPWEEIPPIHPRILHYVAVSDALHDRLVDECGIPAEKVTTILNSVDLDRFRPRPSLPAVPKRALVLNNLATEENLVGIVRAACAQNGIALDVIGYKNQNPTFQAEEQLVNYDIVFGVGRVALEGLACGAAVICCGLEAAGQMVTSQNLDRMRRNNFGIRVLDRPFNVESVSAEIQRYEPVDAQKVCQMVRATAGLTGMVDRILEVYNAALETWEKTPPPDPAAESLVFSAYLKGISDKVYQSIADFSSGSERIKNLEAEVENIKNSTTWRLARRFAGFWFIRGFHKKILTPIRGKKAFKRS